MAARVPEPGSRTMNSSADPAEFDPRKFFKEALLAARALCRERFEQFGCAGRAARIRPEPLETLARRYAV
jgi:fructose-bisphosphate aldolase class II